MCSRARRQWSVLACAAALSLLPAGSGSGLLADTVHLKSGEVLTGRVLRVSAEEVSIRLESGGVVSFRAHRVDRVLKERTPGGDTDLIRYTETGPVIEKKDEAEHADSRGPAGGLMVGPARPGPAGPDGGGSTDALSGFPLHAQRSDPKAADSEPAEGDRFRDPKNGYSLMLPSGFRPMPSPGFARMLKSFKEPTSQANVTIAFEESADDPDKIKETILRVMADRFSSTVIREARRDRTGPNGYRGWVLDLENVVNGVTVRQLQLLAKQGKKVYIVTCSSTAKDYQRLAKEFESCLSSFDLDPAAEGEDGKLPSEVQSYLESGGSRGPSPTDHPSQIDPYSFRPNVEKMMDKIDQRARANPLQPYTIRP